MHPFSGRRGQCRLMVSTQASSPNCHTHKKLTRSWRSWCARLSEKQQDAVRFCKTGPISKSMRANTHLYAIHNELLKLKESAFDGRLQSNLHYLNNYLCQAGQIGQEHRDVIRALINNPHCVPTRLVAFRALTVNKFRALSTQVEGADQRHIT